MQICEICGYNIEEHDRFRHSIKNKINITRTTKGLKYNREDFEDTNNTRCSVPQCKAGKNLHETKVITHKYSPEDYTYKNIKICLPMDLPCNKCSLTFNKHIDEQTHIFECLLEVKKVDSDVLTLFHGEDEDVKVKPVFSS
jgi:hypothetical protein